MRTLTCYTLFLILLRLFLWSKGPWSKIADGVNIPYQIRKLQLLLACLRWASVSLLTASSKSSLV